jgi:uncharacterized protein involved in exopolysaccharide biosynthesis
MASKPEILPAYCPDAILIVIVALFAGMCIAIAAVLAPIIMELSK